MYPRLSYPPQAHSEQASEHRDTPAGSDIGFHGMSDGSMGKDRITDPSRAPSATSPPSDVYGGYGSQSFVYDLPRIQVRY